MTYKLSSYTDYRQLFLIIITAFFALILFLFFWVDKSMSKYLIISIFAFLVYINVINSLLYDISILDGKIVIENLYRKKEIIAGSAFDKVERVAFFYLLAMMFSPPFYAVKLKDGRNYIFLNNSYKAYFLYSLSVCTVTLISLIKM